MYKHKKYMFNGYKSQMLFNFIIKVIFIYNKITVGTFKVCTSPC